MNREEKITAIIEYTKKYDKDKGYFKDAIKRSYYKNYSISNINMIFYEYYLA
jgi:hypothetical protein|tara:strand:- start:286 stop:441 length:156 start_codon:yes stop_codon:yes gene_type:complete